METISGEIDMFNHDFSMYSTVGNFALTSQYAAPLRLKKTIFKQATETKKAVFTTLLTTYPALKNKYYLEEIDNEVTMDKLFEIAE